MAESEKRPRQKRRSWEGFGDAFLISGLILTIGAYFLYTAIARSYGLASLSKLYKLPQFAPHWQLWLCGGCMGLGAVFVLFAVFAAVSGPPAVVRCDRCGGLLDRPDGSCPKCDREMGPI